MSSSNCCFLTCIQISQEAGQVVWYSHLLKNFPQFIMIHTVKGFGIVNKAEIDVFLELSCFFNDPMDVGNLISGSSAFSKASLRAIMVSHNKNHEEPFQLQIPLCGQLRPMETAWRHSFLLCPILPSSSCSLFESFPALPFPFFFLFQKH